MDECRKRLTQARTAWMSGRLGNGRILEWKPFLVGFRLEFDGVADIVIVELAGEFGFFRERFGGGFSGVVGKCGKLNAGCG